MRLAPPLAAALVTLALLVAGCTGMPGATDKPTTPKSDAPAATTRVADATAGLARADETARAWHADAALRMVIGTEGVNAQPDDPPYLYDTRADPNVGDGLALAWTYLYTANGSRSPLVVTIDGDGAILYQHEVTSERSSPASMASGVDALQAPFLASARAADVVLANETSRAFVAEHPTTFTHLALVATQGSASWYYQRSTATGYSLGAVVNATSGALMSLYASGQEPRPPVVCPDCGPHPQPPRPPSPPPKPADEDAKKTSTLNAFNPQADFTFAPQHPDFSYALTLAVDVPGTSPIDDRTFTVTDPSGFVLAERTGTGHLEAKLDGNSTMMPGAPYRSTVTSRAPPAQDQVVTFTAHVVYGAYAPFSYRAFSSGGSSVSFQQTADSTLRVVENATNTLRITFMTNGPATPASAGNATTWRVLDPEGKEIGHGTSPKGEVAFPSTAGGAYTLRVTGGSDAAFGQSYRYTLSSAPQRSSPPRSM